MSNLVFADRRDAGRQLADVIVARAFKDPVVLALPRGGVPVALEVARRLEAPIDLVLVRKIGCPRQPELAVGAVVDGARPEIVTNDRIMARTGTPETFIEEEAARQLKVIEQRRHLWMEGRLPISVTGRTAIVVDDGIATGATVKAALHALKRQNPARLVVATAVAPPDTVAALEAEADEVIVLSVPEDFPSVGSYYRDFTQVSDDEVTAMMAELRRRD